MKSLLLTLAMTLGLTAFAGEAAPVDSFKLQDGREILTDAQHMTLYVFDVDQGSTSNCYDRCAKAWPPLLVPAGTSLTAPLGLTTRKDGSLQVTVDGRPVYFFAGDDDPGEINGDGLQGVWHIILKQP